MIAPHTAFLGAALLAFAARAAGLGVDVQAGCGLVAIAATLFVNEVWG